MERVPSVLGRQGRVRGLLIALDLSPHLLTAANGSGVPGGRHFCSIISSHGERWGAAMSVTWADMVRGVFAGMREWREPICSPIVGS
jgi:hypothetical protein